MSSCVVPQSCCDEHKPISYQEAQPAYRYYPTYYKPKVVIIKKKPHNKRHIKVKINKHRKRK
jgi:hypothetical protein